MLTSAICHLAARVGFVTDARVAPACDDGAALVQRSSWSARTDWNVGASYDEWEPSQVLFEIPTTNPDSAAGDGTLPQRCSTPAERPHSTARRLGRSCHS